TAPSVTVMCPSDSTGPIDVSVYRAASGTAKLGTARIDPLATGPDILDVSLSAPTSVAGGSPYTVSGTLSFGGQPVRGTVTWYAAPAAGGSWVRIGGPAATTPAGTTSISTTPGVSEKLELVVAQPAGSTWTASP